MGTESPVTTTPAPSEHRTATRPSGRIWLWLGVLLPIAGIAAYAVQFNLHRFQTPWYVPVAGSAGVACLAVAVWKRASVVRVGALLVFGLLCAGEWHFLLSDTLLPGYDGPVALGQALPAFTVVQGDGRHRPADELVDHQATALVLFRGRW